MRPRGSARVSHTAGQRAEQKSAVWDTAHALDRSVAESLKALQYRLLAQSGGADNGGSKKTCA